MRKLAFVFLFFFSTALWSIENQELTAANESKWLGKFFSDLFLEQGAIYTLWGSKPITAFPIYLFTNEEIQEFYNQLTEEQKNLVNIVENYDFPANWEKWEIFQKQLDIRKFEIFLKENSKNPKVPEVWFVNVLQTALTIEEHYDLFSKNLGFDFEVHEIMKEIKDPNSIFWNTASKKPLLLGILFGFGKTNALCFHWKNHKDNRISKALEYTFSDSRKLGSTSADNFPIPIFASFTKNDPIISKYKKERADIKEQYKRKNFVQTTLQKLRE